MCKLWYILSLNDIVDMTAKTVELKSFSKCLGRLIGGSIVLLFLWFFSKDKELAQDVVADDDYYLYDERDDGDPSIWIEM